MSTKTLVASFFLALGIPAFNLYAEAPEQFYPDNMLSRVEGNIRITASDCLIDSNIPLRYSLQNAFDNAPATSYVENTEDDLMKIEFSGIYRLEYINNNRIKKVKRGSDEGWLFEDL